MFMFGIIVVFLFLLGGLAAWQRRLDRAEKLETLEKIQHATDHGSNKPVGQYPEINPYLCIGCGSCIRACPEDEVIGLVNGVAHVIRAARCIGHALCEEVCPVNAIKVGLGNVAMRPDIPILSPEQETSVPGLFIAGELAGLALIRIAINTGAKAIETIARRLRAHPTLQDPGIFDVAIVGAGPCGLAASLKAIELKLNYVTLTQDELGGTVRKYPRRKLTLIQDIEMPLYGRIKGGEYEKEVIVELWDKILKQFQVQIQPPCSLADIKHQNACFEITTTTQTYRARYVLLAMGRRGTPRKLGVPGEEASKVLYHLVDAASYNNQKLLIVGGGDSAVEAAIGLANQNGNTVTLSYRKENFFRLKSRNEKRIQEYVAQNKIQVHFSSQIESVDAAQVVLAIDAAGAKQRLTIPNDYVFIFAGGDPPYPLLKKFGIRFGGESAEPPRKLHANYGPLFS